MIKLELLGKQSEWEWDNFVNSYVNKEYGFTLKWRNVLRDVFGYETLYYLIKEDAKLIGIFPVCFVRSNFFGNRLISLPFTDMGGFYFRPMLHNHLKLEAFYNLLEKLRTDLRFSLKKLQPFEIRGPSYDSNSFLIEKKLFIKISPYVKLVVKLDNSWLKIEQRFSRNLKRNLAKSKGHLEINVCKKRDQLQELYGIYLKDMRRLGSPPLPLIFLEKLWDEFYPEGDFIIFTASYKRQIIGAITLIVFKDSIYADLIMSLFQYKHLFPKMQLYLASLNYAYNSKKYIRYDFNRTRRQSKTFEHKQKWGGQVEEIEYFYLNNGYGNNCFLDSQQKSFSLASKIIKYTPLGILSAVGLLARKQVAK